MKIKFALRWGCLLFWTMLIVCPGFSQNTLGSIIVPAGFVVTPNPVDNPTNLRFFLNNAAPAPTAAGTVIPVSVSQDAGNYVYEFSSSGTITVLVETAAQYGRITTQAINKTSGLPSAMTFTSGTYKSYTLPVDFRPNFNKQAPEPSPSPITATLTGYTADEFRPIISASVPAVVTNNNTEVSFYRWVISATGADLATADTSTGWAPPTANLLAADVTRTYTLSVKSGNWYGTSAVATTKDLEVKSPGTGGTDLVYNLNISFNNLSDNGLLSWNFSGSAVNFDLYMSDTNAGPWTKTNGSLLNLVPNAEGEFTYALGDLTAYADDQHAIRYLKVVPQNQDPATYHNEAVGIARFTIARSADPNTGITSISLPFNTTYGFLNGGSQAITTATDLRNVVGTGFQFVGGWDETTQKEVFFGLDAGSNPLGDANMPLVPGRGYQISMGPDPNNPNATTYVFYLVGK